MIEGNRKEELIMKLAESWESVSLLQDILQRDQRNLAHELRLADEARRILNDVLFELTGNNFYKNEEIK